LCASVRKPSRRNLPGFEMRVIYNTCFADPWLNVARELRDRHGLEPVYWIGYEIDDSARLVPAAFANAVYHPIFDAWKGIFPAAIARNNAYSHINIDFIREYSSFELQALKMMDRMDPDCHSFSFSERQRHYRNFIKNWTSCIRLLKPELVISATLPHRVYDYVLYLLCRHLRIPFAMFLHTAFPGRILPLRDICSIGAEIKDAYSDILNGTTDFNLLKSNLSPDILERFQNVQKDYQRGKPAYMDRNESQHRQSANTVALSNKFLTEALRQPGKYFGKKGYVWWGFPTYLKQRNKRIEASRLSIIDYSTHKIKANRLKRKLKKYYDSLAELPDLHEPYVFLPLHYQPEMTSSPTGDIFVDQSLCVELLLKNVPPDWKIYVKEHPAQYQSHGEGQTSRIREFYDDLLKFPNVRLIPFQSDSFDLIANAKAVATITGTVGWEAMVRRKPVLLFSSAWYEDYPGALKISNEEAAREICDFIRNFTYDEKKLLAYLAALEKNSLRAYYFRGLKEKMNQPEKECVENLVVSLIHCIQK
jgi:hypothetical protein